ncbi:MAG: hypothetical protein Q7T94_05725 [Rugosibacter sp.]|nr:hypothetical protein [Rugosibacter sp.]
MKRDRTSWAEEHKNFRRRAAALKPNTKWSLGIYQDLQDDEPLNTKFKDNSLFEFLVPEQHLSLKLFFDNLRNYGICAGFAALGAWIWVAAPQQLPATIPVWAPYSLSIATWTLVACLLVLNCFQTWFLTTELFYAVRIIRNSYFRIYHAHGSMVNTFFIIIHFIVSTLINWLILTLIPLFSLTIVAISVSFVVYALISQPLLRGAA